MFDPTAESPSLHDLYTDANISPRASGLPDHFPDDFTAADQAAMHAAFGYDQPVSDDELDAMWVADQERRDAEIAAADAADARSEAPPAPDSFTCPVSCCGEIIINDGFGAMRWHERHTSQRLLVDWTLTDAQTWKRYIVFSHRPVESAMKSVVAKLVALFCREGKLDGEVELTQLELNAVRTCARAEFPEIKSPEPIAITPVKLDPAAWQRKIG